MTSLRPLPAVQVAYMAQRCCDIRGRTWCARAVGVDVEDMRRIATGLVVANVREREVIERIFATLLWDEIDGDCVVPRQHGEHKTREEKTL